MRMLTLMLSHPLRTSGGRPDLGIMSEFQLGCEGLERVLNEFDFEEDTLL